MGRGRLGSGSEACFRELRFGVRGAVDGSPLRVCFGWCRQKRERSEVMNIDRKGIVGIVLAVLGFGGWQVYYTRQVQRAADAQKQAAQTAQAAKAAEPAVVTGSAGSQSAPGAASQPAPETAAAGGTAAVSVKEEKTPLKIGSTEYVFSNLGGGVVAARLLGHKSEQGAVLVLNEFGEVPIGAVTEVAGDGVRKPHSFEVEPGGRAIRFERTDARQVRWVKRFVLPPEESVSKGGAGEYGLRLELTVTNQGGANAYAFNAWNPPLAMAASAAAYAKTMAFATTIPAFERGGNVANDGLALLHKNEMVLPSPIADSVRNITEGGMGAGSVTFNINAMDASSFDTYLKANAGSVFAANKLALRNGSQFA